MRYDFTCPTRIHFGCGRAQEAFEVGRSFGRHVLVVTGSNPARHARFTQALGHAGFRFAVHAVRAEPNLRDIELARDLGRTVHADWILAIGGGAAIDAAKATAAALRSSGILLDYLEVVGSGRPLEGALPVVALPTTAGTGAEVTRNAVLAVPAHRLKASLRSSLLYPRAAIVDPDLCLGTPPAVAAASGLDAITQLIESLTSRRSGEFTSHLCADGLARAGHALPRALEKPDDDAAWTDLAHAALLSGLALANAGLGAVHGLAGPLGGALPAAPHGVICARLLPHVLAANAAASGAALAARYDAAAALVLGRASATLADLSAWTGALADQAGLPRLRDLGLGADLIPAVAAQSLQSSSMRGNPVDLPQDALAAILTAAL